MNQTLPTADLNTAGTTDIIPSVAIDRIIAQRNEGIALFTYRKLKNQTIPLSTPYAT